MVLNCHHWNVKLAYHHVLVNKFVQVPQDDNQPSRFQNLNIINRSVHLRNLRLVPAQLFRALFGVTIRDGEFLGILVALDIVCIETHLEMLQDVSTQVILLLCLGLKLVHDTSRQSKVGDSQELH